MAYICSCGLKVKHAWSHVECAVKETVELEKGTTFYEIVKRDHQTLVEKYEKELLKK